MPRVAKPECIRLYEPGADGLAKAVYYDENGNESILLEESSLSDLKKIIYQYKKDNDMMQVRVEPKVGQSYEYGNGKPKEGVNRIPVTKRFEMAEQVIEMILQDYVTSCVLCGQGGCGKSYTVLEMLHKNGYSTEEGARKHYKHLRGSVSPMELYIFLYKHRNELIVFDDADAVFQTETSTNILKAVLDTTGPREVAWYSGALDDDVPNEFEFTGKIIFISNRMMDKIPDPIRSRAMLLDLSFTREELVERMRELARDMCPNLSDKQRKELLDHIEKHANTFKHLSLRTLSKAGKIVEAGIPDWKSVTLFAG